MTCKSKRPGRSNKEQVTLGKSRDPRRALGPIYIQGNGENQETAHSWKPSEQQVSRKKT